MNTKVKRGIYLRTKAEIADDLKDFDKRTQSRWTLIVALILPLAMVLGVVWKLFPTSMLAFAIGPLAISGMSSWLLGLYHGLSSRNWQFACAICGMLISAFWLIVWGLLSGGKL